MPGLRHSTPQSVTIRPLRETFTIGRDAQNDLALLDDPLVSHQHACIRHVGDMYVIEDLHSTNGTFLERELQVTRITSPQPLLPHDVIIHLAAPTLPGAALGRTAPSATRPRLLH
jgi:pSer/pThr/pTyr-binding forkhead associated (FHA) protein